MSAVSKVISKARSQIGTKESPAGSNKVKYNTAYYGRAVSGSDYPWCCAFVWWVFKQCGAPELFYGGKKTASCTTLMNYYKSKDQFSKTPKVGSLVFFNWGKGTEAKHIGIVTAITSSGVKTIEGNTAVGNDSNGGEVMERTRYTKDILGYAYPYEGGVTMVNITLPQLRKGDTGESVRALQILLNGLGYNCGTVDGEFGAKTQDGVRRFQRTKGLTVDGIVGANTWSEVLK